MKARLLGRVACAAAGLAALALALARPAGPEEARAGLSARTTKLGLALRIAVLEEEAAELAPPRLPSGAPTALGCDEARLVTAQARGALAEPAPPLDPFAFAEATIDWLDPHGLWSVAPDSPVAAVVRREARALLAELEAGAGSAGCGAASRIGRALSEWVLALRPAFEAGLAEGRAASLPAPPPSVFTTPFEDGKVSRPARWLARRLGRDLGEASAALGPAVATELEATRGRLLPELDAAGWADVVVAAALRAYVPGLDAHGAWAPLDEEFSIYDLALETDPPARLWAETTRTALGVRVDRGARPPLEDGDVVLDVGSSALGGMSVEQASQYAILAEPNRAVRVRVLRKGRAEPLELSVASPRPERPGRAEPEEPGAGAELVRYGDGSVLVFAASDVPDDLGGRIVRALRRAEREGPLRGIVLDLRGNGGGSTDGAASALGVFLPGAPLFPMRRRDGHVEVERAPEPPESRRYAGPVATLVDGDSASAAEMIAGALASYGRGAVLGARTYGKGCAQEYLDDDAQAGVLRLTTLLYALPDGSPVQKLGIVPGLLLGLAPSPDREALVPRALGPWRGPDVRDRSLVGAIAWPDHGGRVGPCRDEVVCRALRTLGRSVSAARP